MNEEYELECLIALDGAAFEMSSGHVVEFTVRRTETTRERPHGVSYALVFREAGGRPLVRFDNAHAIERPGGRFVKRNAAFDHRHRSETDPGRPYAFTTAAKLLDDFWDEVRRVLDEKGIDHDL